jgi:hypothetical protein
MAPSKPLLYPEQLGLVILSVFAIGIGVYVAIRVFF